MGGRTGKQTKQKTELFSFDVAGRTGKQTKPKTEVFAFRVTSETAADIRIAIAKAHLPPGQFYLAATAMLCDNMDAFQAGFVAGQQTANTVALRLIAAHKKENARHARALDRLFRDLLDVTALPKENTEKGTT